MDELLRKRNDVSGLDEIYAAIDTYDMAVVVRAATNVLRTNELLPIYNSLKKSGVTSSAARKTGIEHYKAGRYREAIQFYNKAIAFAPLKSEEIMLAYGNRSIVFFSIKYFSACFEDATACLIMGCPPDLHHALTMRRAQALLKFPEEQAIHLFANTDFNCTFMSFNCKKNVEVPCASNDIAFVNRDGAKFVTAGTKIKPGALVAIERAFSTCTVGDRYLCCYFCNRIDLRLYPCKYCCQALFCSDKCRDLCWNEYHRIECQVVDSLASIFEKRENILITRTAIKLSLKLGWNALIEASKDIGASRMKKATVKQMYNSDEPLSILSYDDRTHLMGGRMFNGSLNCAGVLHCLGEVPDYLPKGANERNAAWDAMARIMLHLYVTFTNTIHTKPFAYDFNGRCFRDSVQTNFGMFSMSSKLKHSCDPNLMVLGLNDSIGLVALRTITKGEELTISYTGHFYDYPLPNYDVEDKLKRAVHVFIYTQHTCDCRACQNNWDSNSAVEVEMSETQDALFKKLNREHKTMDFKSFYRMCSALDIFPINSLQHKYVYEAVTGILKLIQCKYVQNNTYT